MGNTVNWVLISLAIVLGVVAIGPILVLVAGMGIAVLIVLAVFCVAVMVQINKSGRWWADPIYIWWDSLLTMGKGLFVVNAFVVVTGILFLFGIPVTLAQFHMGWAGFIAGTLAMMPITILAGTAWASMMNRITGVAQNAT